MFMSYRIWVLLSVVIPVLSLDQSISYGQTNVYSHDPDKLWMRFRKDTSVIYSLHRKAGKIRQKHPDSAIVLYQQGYTISSQIFFPDGIAKSLLEIASVYAEQGKYQQAILLLERAYPFCKKSIFRKTLVAVYDNNKAQIYYMQGNYTKAITYYVHAIQELKRSHAPEGIALTAIYCNLSSILLNQGHDESALYYLDQGERIARANKLYRPLAMILINKGIIHSNRNNIVKARIYYLEALSIGKNINYIEAQINALVNIGDDYIKKLHNEEAIFYLNQAIILAEQLKIESYQIIPSYYLGKAYFEKKNYVKAENLLSRALKRSQTLGMEDNIVEARLTLAKTYAVLNKKDLAYDQMQKAWTARDSQMSKERVEAVSDIEAKYRTAEKDKELMAKQLVITKQHSDLHEKNFWILCISAAIILIMALMFSLHRSDKHKQLVQQAEIINIRKEQEIGQLKAMVKGEEKERSRVARELHDGIVGLLSAIRMNFNAIQTKHKLGEADDFSEALEQLNEASNEVRKTAYNLMPEVLLDGGLSEALEHYCKKMDKGEEHNIIFDLYGELPQLDPDFELSAYRIVQELIQNAIKHAAASQIIVQLNYREGLLGITVEDNGKGIGPDILARQKGMGLRNLATRVKAFHGQMQMDSQPGNGTTVFVEFNIATATA
jgi:two-component system NarL family sensor kinase